MLNKLVRLIGKAGQGHSQWAGSPHKATLHCDKCHWEMEFISIEMGYSCRNPNCTLHVVKGVA
jgi:hypothetical protein